MFNYYTYNDIVNGGEHDFEVETSRDYFVGKFGWLIVNEIEENLKYTNHNCRKIVFDNQIFKITYTKDLETCNICGAKFDNVNNAYEPYVCDKCFDEYFGYCDNCGEVFAYHKNMCDDTSYGVLCGKCLCQVKKEDRKC